MDKWWCLIHQVRNEQRLKVWFAFSTCVAAVFHSSVEDEELTFLPPLPRLVNDSTACWRSSSPAQRKEEETEREERANRGERQKESGRVMERGSRCVISIFPLFFAAFCFSLIKNWKRKWANSEGKGSLQEWKRVLHSSVVFASGRCEAGAGKDAQ